MSGQRVVQDFTLVVGGVTTALVVVGSRAEPRSAIESAVPVDVIRTEDFVAQGRTDLSEQFADRGPLLQHKHSADQ